MKRLTLFLAFFLVASFVRAQEASNATPYSVDFTNVVGKIKPLNGVNLWTNFSCSRAVNRQELAEQCKISTVRLHDVPIDNNGMRLVDVHQIFGNLDADASDPDNYFFEASDDYIANIIKSGAEPIYRLGTTIEFTERHYFAKRPDPEQYAEICAGIVRHYNEGWANGFHWNIRYWEIWNEADGWGFMWDSSEWDTYCSFYVVVAKRLRAEFPDIKIGGPALVSPRTDLIGRLLEFCEKENAPLDFCSWHTYTTDPQALIEAPYKVRAFLDEKGFKDAELHLNEWHYFFQDKWSQAHGAHRDYDEQRRLVSATADGTNGHVSAAFNDYVMTRWQDGPLDMANYYCYEQERCNIWGMIDIAGEPRPTYYSFRAFGELVEEAPNRVQTTDEGGAIALLGGIDDATGAKRLLVSVFKSERREPIEIALKGVPESGKVSIGTIDAENYYAESEREYENSVLKLDADDSRVYFIRF